MKLFVTLMFLGSSVFAGTSQENALSAQVIKMGQCTGLKSAEGKEFVFNANHKVVIRLASSEESSEDSAYEGDYENSYGNPDQEDSYENAYSDSDSYDSAYGKESDSDSVTARWTVKGKSVLIEENGRTYSLVIGFKSKTCWEN